MRYKVSLPLRRGDIVEAIADNGEVPEGTVGTIVGISARPGTKPFRVEWNLTTWPFAKAAWHEGTQIVAVRTDS